MVPRILIAICIAAFTAAGVFAQSGRVKPAESPTPATKTTAPPRPVGGTYNPTETPLPYPTTLPNTKKKTDDDDAIKVDSVLVPIPVSVLDARGVPVTTLKLEDFELLVDGRPAEIGDLSRAETPVRLALLFDNSSSVTIAREFEKKAAIRFFKRVIRPDKDLVALFSVATLARLEQPLTKDVSALVAAIENFAAPAGATALLDGMVEASNYLKDFSGRRVMVIVSDGDDTVSDATFEAAMKAVQVANCQVYVVKTTDFENNQRTGNRTGSANLRQLAAERRMQEFASQTGGTVYSPIDEDELDRAFSQISGELSQQYVLSYYPEYEPEKRGEFKTIALSVKNKPALSVRTRKGYFVPRR